MKELMDKYNELEKAKECVKGLIEDLEIELESLRKMIPVDYEGKIIKEYEEKEKTFSSNTKELRSIEKKLFILSEAMDILEGIGVVE